MINHIFLQCFIPLVLSVKKPTNKLTTQQKGDISSHHWDEKKKKSVDM
jgi:hypothetical protein